MVELNDLMGDIARHALAVADSLVSSLTALFSAGMPNGLGPGELAVGASAGVAAAGTTAVNTRDTRTPDQMDNVTRRLRTPYRTSDREPYFPGWSPIPPDRVVYYEPPGTPYSPMPGSAPNPWHGWNRRPVDGDTGRVIHPPDPRPDYGDVRVTATVGAGRG